jgi:hypothetical protein
LRGRRSALVPPVIRRSTLQHHVNPPNARAPVRAPKLPDIGWHAFCGAKVVQLSVVRDKELKRRKLACESADITGRNGKFRIIMCAGLCPMP